jgi:hypothetical protein
MAITAFPFSIQPLNNVQPFTYRDGISHMAILEKLRVYINDVLRVEFNEEMGRILEEYQDGIGNAEETVLLAKAEWLSTFTTFMADVVAQIALLNDDAVASMVTDLDTDTSNALDARYALVATVTAELAALTADLTAEITARGTDNIKWSANRDYVAGQRAISPDGDVVTAYENHTAGDDFQKSLWFADYGYLFANFTYNSVEGEKLNLFYSGDGKTTAGHGPNPVYAPVTGLRDPSILKIGDTWYMAYGYADPTQKKFAIAASTDLMNWAPVAEINVTAATGLTRVWAPELTVNDDGEVYVFFTNVVNEGTEHEAWYVHATNDTLSTWSAPLKLTWTLEPLRVMDPIFQKVGATWFMFYGDNTNICRATAPALLGPWTSDRSGDWAGWGANKEAPSLVRVSDSLWRLYMDRYEGVSPDWTYPGYAYAESADLNTWTGLAAITNGPDAQGIALRHGSFIKITDRQMLAQVTGVMAAGAGAQRYVEGTTGKMIPDTTESNIGPITIDAARSLITGDFTFPADGQIKVGATGVYSFALHAGDDVANNLLNGATEHWITIYSPTMARNLARATGKGGYELTANISNIRCNAGEIIEFRIAQFSGDELPLDCRIHATRIS